MAKTAKWIVSMAITLSLLMTGCGQGEEPNLQDRLDELQHKLTATEIELAKLRMGQKQIESQLTSLEPQVVEAKVGELTVPLPIPRTATKVVAASNSSGLGKKQADYVCDGVDDHVEIQAAIDALPSGGGKVLLLEGTYNLGYAGDIVLYAGSGTSHRYSILIRGRDNIIIQGMGKATTIKAQTLSSGQFGIAICAKNSNYIEVSALSLYHERPGGGYFILFEGCTYSKISNNHAYDGESAYILSDSDYCSITDNSTLEVNCHNIYLTDGSEFNMIARNHLKNFHNAGIGSHCYINESTVKHNVIYGNILQTDPDTYPYSVGIDLRYMQRSIVIGNIIDNVGDIGIAVCHYPGAVGNQVIGNNIIRCKIGVYGSPPGEGLKAGFIVANNEFREIRETAMDLLGIEYSLITGNSFIDCGQTAGAWSLIRLNEQGTYYSKNNVVANNVAYGSTANIAYSIEEVSSNENGNILMNNKVDKPIRILGSESKAVGNIGYATENSGTAAIVSGNTTVTVNHGLASTPKIVVITPRGNIGTVWVTDVGSSEFTINCEIPPQADTQVDWYAETG